MVARLAPLASLESLERVYEPNVVEEIQESQTPLEENPYPVKKKRDEIGKRTLLGHVTVLRAENAQTRCLVLAAFFVPCLLLGLNLAANLWGFQLTRETKTSDAGVMTTMDGTPVATRSFKSSCPLMQLLEMTDAEIVEKDYVTFPAYSANRTRSFAVTMDYSSFIREDDARVSLYAPDGGVLAVAESEVTYTHPAVCPDGCDVGCSFDATFEAEDDSELHDVDARRLETYYDLIYYLTFDKHHDYSSKVAFETYMAYMGSEHVVTNPYLYHTDHDDFFYVDKTCTEGHPLYIVSARDTLCQEMFSAFSAEMGSYFYIHLPDDASCHRYPSWLKQAHVYHDDGIKVEAAVGHKDAHKAAASDAALYCCTKLDAAFCRDAYYHVPGPKPTPAPHGRHW